jgi:HTH-type transcriptional regulator / antitoxin HigA
MTNNSGLRPLWASAPGETIESVMRDRNMNETDVAAQLHMSASDFDDLILGRHAITVSLARSLSKVLGGSSEFWMAREAQYIDDSHRVAAEQWSRAFPIKQMAEFGWIKSPDDWHDRISSCLDFFQVDDVETWDRVYKRQLETAHYRRSPSFSLDHPATAVWFRACEYKAEKITDFAAYDPAAFRSVLSDIRRLTRIKDPQRFTTKLVKMCAAVGVAVTIVRAPSGCPLSGVARWYRDNPLIQLSARHLSDDHLWFSFFHEAGHVLLHQLSVPFVDILEDEAADRYEQEANDFAVSLLVESRDVPRLSRPTTRAVVQIAQQFGVSPGVIVGQLQHTGRLPMNRFNRLKRYYTWNGPNLEMK